MSKDFSRIENEIPFKVVHLSEIINELIKQEKIQIGPITGKSATYHDPCHLGRHMKVYDAPRDVLKLLFDNSFIEMNPNRENAWCCGAEAV